jgi:hypothetical protein
MNNFEEGKCEAIVKLFDREPVWYDRETLRLPFSEYSSERKKNSRIFCFQNLRDFFLLENQRL